VNGRAFLNSARHLLAAPCEENWRSAVGRADYALLHEAQAAFERWGFPLPPHESIHNFVRRHLGFPANPDLRNASRVFDRLTTWRNEADYQRSVLGRFGSAVAAVAAVQDAQDTIALLDAIEADAARRAAAVTALHAAFP
jgi:hypothetical protein